MIFTQCFVMNKAKKFSYDGPDIGFDRAKSRQVDSTVKQKPQGWEFPAVDANQVNAKANTKTGTVKVTMSKAAFLGRVAANDSAVLLAA